MCDLKVAQINVQDSIILELMLNKFKLGHNAAKVANNICCAKSESVVDHSTVTRWLKNFTWFTRTFMIWQA